MLGPIEDLLSEENNNNSSSENSFKLQLIHRNALRLLKLVNSLLDFSRMESDRFDSVFSPTDLKGKKIIK